MNVDIGTLAAQSQEKEHIKEIFVQCLAFVSLRVLSYGETVIKAL
jgi:hypothetical protein